MKKLLVLPLLFGLCCACAPKSLPVPDYPLDSATVEAALEQAGLPWVAGEPQSWTEGQTAIELRDGQGNLMAVLSSVAIEQQRGLALTIPVSTEQAQDAQRQWEGLFAMAAVLWGGFESADALYEDFSDNFDEKSTSVTSKQEEADDGRRPGGRRIFEKTVRFETQVEDGRCHINLGGLQAQDEALMLYGIHLSSATEGCLFETSEKGKTPYTPQS